MLSKASFPNKTQDQKCSGVVVCFERQWSELPPGGKMHWPSGATVTPSGTSQELSTRSRQRRPLGSRLWEPRCEESTHVGQSHVGQSHVGAIRHPPGTRSSHVSSAAEVTPSVLRGTVRPSIPGTGNGSRADRKLPS